MGPFLKQLLFYVLGSALARVLAGAGLAVATAPFISDFVDDALANAVTSVGLLDPALLNLILLAGIGDALSIIGSALVARVTIVTASAFVGVSS